jgi:hypothetical protein
MGLDMSLTMKTASDSSDTSDDQVGPIPTPTPNPKDDEISDQVAMGVTLFASKCASCHPESAMKSPVRGTTATTLTNAIDDIPAMTFLNSLTDEEVNAIVAALNHTFNQDPAGSMLSRSGLHGQRLYVASNFKTVFKNSAQAATDADERFVDTTVNTYILTKPGEFGGPCHPVERQATSVCNFDRTAAIGAQVLPDTNTLRSGFQIRACSEILQRENIVNKVLAAAGLNSNSDVNQTNVTRVFDHFYPGQTISADIIAGAMAVASKGASMGYTKATAWQFIALEFCSSPLFEQL